MSQSWLVTIRLSEAQLGVAAGACSAARGDSVSPRTAPWRQPKATMRPLSNGSGTAAYLGHGWRAMFVASCSRRRFGVGFFEAARPQPLVALGASLGGLRLELAGPLQRVNDPVGRERLLAEQLQDRRFVDSVAMPDETRIQGCRAGNRGASKNREESVQPFDVGGTGLGSLKPRVDGRPGHPQDLRELGLVERQGGGQVPYLLGDR